jgi:hypothetical protein
MEQNLPAVGAPVEPPVRPDPERAAFALWCRENGHGELDDMLTPLDRSLRSLMWPVWQGAVASARARDATPDQVIDLAEALQVRRILEEIKKVAALHPADDVPTMYQAAWQACCEEIFYRATGEQWHMDEDAGKFMRRAANEPRA